jgi:myo-inositol-1(or 4)-monophosphatase
MNYKKFIEETLKEVSPIAREQLGHVSATVKGSDNNQVLTGTDLLIGKTLIRKIQKNFPEHNIIDEEAGVIDKQSEYTWVVDPIDGTSNFANGVLLYGIMLGLLKHDIPVAGGIALPNFSEIYSAEKGEGSFCNGERINISKEVRLKNSLVAYGIDGHQENSELTKKECRVLADIVLNIRNLRSSNSAFDIAMVAKGSYGAALNQTSKIWDNVAQHIIIEEAGGLYTDFFGEKMDYSSPLSRVESNFTYFAASPLLHQQLLTVIKGQTGSHSVQAAERVSV